MEFNRKVIKKVQTCLDNIKDITSKPGLSKEKKAELNEIGFGGLLLLFMIQDIPDLMPGEIDEDLEETHREIDEFLELVQEYYKENNVELATIA